MSEVRKSAAVGPTAGVVVPFPSSGARMVDQAASSVSRNDSVETTSLARRLASASTHVKEAHGERAERVAALKAAIESGTYRPDPEAIARALLGRAL